MRVIAESRTTALKIRCSASSSAIVHEGVILGGDLNFVIPSDELYSCFLALPLSNGTPQQNLARKAQGKSVVHVRRKLQALQIVTDKSGDIVYIGAGTVNGDQFPALIA